MEPSWKLFLVKVGIGSMDQKLESHEQDLQIFHQSSGVWFTRLLALRAEQCFIKLVHTRNCQQWAS